MGFKYTFITGHRFACSHTQQGFSNMFVTQKDFVCSTLCNAKTQGKNISSLISIFITVQTLNAHGKWDVIGLDSLTYHIPYGYKHKY